MQRKLRLREVMEFFINCKVQSPGLNPGMSDSSHFDHWYLWRKKKCVFEMGMLMLKDVS